ncbi:MAG: YkgJ family cysteine cluster protein [Deltaproteobacteria bacterium]|nr:YkgJ family cysteine cluster protein [Deltaproteobacteria bacterium]
MTLERAGTKAFDCKRCGTCCYGEGGIFLDPEERDTIAAFLRITPRELQARYCEQRNGRLSVKTGRDNYCIFYHREKQCLIHEVKPGVCSLWPFYPALLKDPDAWLLAQDACPGINSRVSHEEFKRQSPK